MRLPESLSRSKLNVRRCLLPKGPSRHHDRSSRLGGLSTALLRRQGYPQGQWISCKGPLFFSIISGHSSFCLNFEHSVLVRAVTLHLVPCTVLICPSVRTYRLGGDTSVEWLKAAKGDERSGTKGSCSTGIPTVANRSSAVCVR